MSPTAKPTPLASLLGTLSQEKRWRERFGLHAVFLFWHEVVGEEIACRAQPHVIRGTVLWVEVSDPVWLQQLHLQRGLLLGEINGRLATEAKLTDIRFQLNSALDRETVPVIEELPPESPQQLSPDETRELDQLLAVLPDDGARATMRRFWLKAHNKK